MKKVRILVWLVVGLGGILPGNFAHAGGGDSGGSSIIHRAQPLGPILLDLFIRKPDFVDKHRLPAKKLADCATPEHFGLLQRIDARELPSYQFALKRLDMWRSNSPALIALVETALPITHFSYVDQIPGLPQGFVIPDALMSLARAFDLIPLAYYKPSWGVILSASEWELVGDYSHAGALIHETFRELKANYGLKFTKQEESMEEIVGRIMIEAPAADSPRLQGEDYIEELPDFSTLPTSR